MNKQNYELGTVEASEQLICDLYLVLFEFTDLNSPHTIKRYKG